MRLRKQREVTPEQLQEGYLVSAFHPGLLWLERKAYVVIRETEHGTYIVEEPKEEQEGDEDENDDTDADEGGEDQDEDEDEDEDEDDDDDRGVAV